MLLKKEDMGRLIASVIHGGARFVAPSVEARQVVYKAIASEMDLAEDYILPRNSFKEFLFPQTEVIAEFRFSGGSVDLEGRGPEAVETVVFGARPCEAASTAALRSVFTWDHIDGFYTAREDNVTVIAAACTKGDSECFCTTVGVAPDSTAGSDILLREIVEGGYLAEAVTERGRAFMERHPAVFKDGPAAGATPREIFVPGRVEGVQLPGLAGLAVLAERLSGRDAFEGAAWAELSRKCIGCGACTFVCPTCHCFDITDEADAFEGERRKNWDSCQFDHFTLHSSGHNPRETQWKRWRNRFMCKFHIYPRKFSSKGCVGCGRCVRVCPVGLDIRDAMEEFSRRDGRE
jgi:ferredoxin